MFATPHSLKLDPPLPEDENQSTEATTTEPSNQSEKPRGKLSLFGLVQPKQESDDTRTGISSDSEKKKPDLKLTAELVATALGLVFVGASFVVRIRKGRQLRQPTKKHLADMGEPLASIASRHVNPALLNADLIDLIKLGSATGAYLTDGPLTHGVVIDSGVRSNEERDEGNAA